MEKQMMLDLVNLFLEDGLDYVAAGSIVIMGAYVVGRWASLGSLRFYRKVKS
jgi:hypothetical protein